MFPAAGGEREDLVGQRGRRDLCRGVQGKKNGVKGKVKIGEDSTSKILKARSFLYKYRVLPLKEGKAL